MKLGYTFQLLLTKLLVHRRIVSSVLAGLILVLGGALLLYPKVVAIRQTGILDLNREEQQLTQRQDYLVRLQRSLEEFRTIDTSQADSLNAILPSEEDLPGLFVALDDLIKQSGLTLASISITPGTTASAVSATSTGKTTATALPTQLRALNIQLVTSVGADYALVKQLIANVEASQRLLDLTALSFTPAGVSTQGPAAATLNLRTYYLAPPST